MKKTGLTLFVAVMLGSSPVGMAQAKPDYAIRYRQSVYTAILWNYLPMGDMVRGKTPYDKAAFALRAERVAALTPMLLEGFPKGSDRGAKTEAKPNIWSDFADFSAKMKSFETESKTLATVSAAGDLEKIKTQFAKVSETCKSCHSKFKTD
jgi:cytochrome c556